MTMNEKIAAAALEMYNAPAAKVGNVATVSGLCLKFVRLVVEKAYGVGDHEWYKHQVTEWVQPSGFKTSTGHWARDAERSLRNLGFQIPNNQIKAGDIVCKYDTASVSPSLWGQLFASGTPYQSGVNIGHIAIYLGEFYLLQPNGSILPEKVVIENINPAYRAGGRALAARGALSLTRWSHLPSPTSVFRLPERIDEKYV